MAVNEFTEERKDKDKRNRTMYFSKLLQLSYKGCPYKNRLKLALNQHYQPFFMDNLGQVDSIFYIVQYLIKNIKKYIFIVL